MWIFGTLPVPLTMFEQLPKSSKYLIWKDPSMIQLVGKNHGMAKLLF